jgi:hypothetical protein
MRIFAVFRKEFFNALCTDEQTPLFGAFFMLFWNKSAKSRQKRVKKKANQLTFN